MGSHFEKMGHCALPAWKATKTLPARAQIGSDILMKMRRRREIPVLAGFSAAVLLCILRSG